MADSLAPVQMQIKLFDEQIDQIETSFTNADDVIVERTSHFQSVIDQARDTIISQLDKCRIEIQKNQNLAEALALVRKTFLSHCLPQANETHDSSSHRKKPAAMRPYSIPRLKQLEALSSDVRSTSGFTISSIPITSRLPDYIPIPVTEDWWRSAQIFRGHRIIHRNLESFGEPEIVPLNATGLKYDWPFGIALHPLTEMLYVANYGSHEVLVLHPDGSFSHKMVIKKEGTEETAKPQFSFQNPNDIAISPDGSRIMISDHTANTVAVFDGQTEALLEVVTIRTPNVTVQEPRGVTVDADGNFYATDSRNSRILKFSSDLAFIKFITTNEIDPGISSPMSILATQTNELYVLSDRGSNIAVFDLDGNYLRNMPIAATGEYNYLSHGPSGSFAVSDVAGFIRFYSHPGTELKCLKVPGAVGCIFDSKGTLYALDRRSHCLYRL
eukprot:TRINITY_DN11412_c0_g2_i1.p1 TRINITY_DN11412_c0_g2~~TRINITY_DN11412_c0_g2_i1.p1  ORF type:complete len:442 (+),score=89.13 TRINITY_DN11412_c0_g2_i1:61-1386(+)